MLSEMAQLLLQQKAHAQQISIDEYNGKQNMPSDIFTKLPSEEVGKKVSRHFEGSKTVKLNLMDHGGIDFKTSVFT